MRFAPMPLRLVRRRFDADDWLFDLKWDGFRALAYIESSGVTLVSRTGHVYRQYDALRHSRSASTFARGARRSLVRTSIASVVAARPGPERSAGVGELGIVPGWIPTNVEVSIDL